jgi:hypothetical protein
MVTRRGSVVVVKNGLDASVECWHQPQVRGRKPAERDSRGPAAFVQQSVKHLIVWRLTVAPELHRFGPCGQQPLGTVRLVEKCHSASHIWGSSLLDVAGVRPKVEKRHITGPVGPLIRQEELRKFVELEINVQEGDRLTRLLKLIEQEEGL